MLYLLTYEGEQALVLAHSRTRAYQTKRLYGLCGTLTKLLAPPANVETLRCYSDRVIEDVAANLRANREEREQ